MEDALICFLHTLDLERLATALALHDRALLARPVTTGARRDFDDIAPGAHLLEGEHVWLKVAWHDSKSLELLAIFFAFRHLVFGTN